MKYRNHRSRQDLIFQSFSLGLGGFFRNQQNQRKRCKQWGNKLVVGGWKVWNLVTDDSKGKLSKRIVQIFCLVNSNLHDPVFPQVEVKTQKALPQISGAHSYGHKPDGLAKFVFS